MNTKSYEETYIRKPKILKTFGFGNSTLYEKIKSGEFPAPYRLFNRISVWKESEIKEWMEKNIKRAE